MKVVEDEGGGRHSVFKTVQPECNKVVTPSHDVIYVSLDLLWIVVIDG